MSRCRWLPLLVFAVIAWPIDAQVPPDLDGYVTLDKAITTTVKRLPFALQQPGHLGIGVENDGAKIKVVRVEIGSSADKAGLKVGDTIKQLDGAAIGGIDSLRQTVATKRPGQDLELALDRNGKPLKLTVKLSAPSNPLGDAAPTKAILGVQLDNTDKGVKIVSVTAGSPADAAGLKMGDVVQRLDGTATATLDDLRARLARRAPGDTVKVALVRDEKPMELAVELGAPPAPIDDMPTLARWDDRNPALFREPVYKLAVIPIAFDDVKPNEKITTDAWDKALFSSGQYKDKNATGQSVYGSVNDFYAEISCGKFKITGKVFPAVTVKKKRTEYTQAPNRTLLSEALDLLIARDGEGTLTGYDGVFFIYSGNRVPTQRGAIYWPHRSTLNYKGARWPYFICPEGGERMSTISVISHEFGHMIGMPDLYSSPDMPDVLGLGVWCTMSTGHGSDGKPLHFSAWCKEKLGWAKPVVIDPRVKQKLILGPVLGSDNQICKVLLRQDGSEYLLLENRIKKGFDRDLPAEGLLIWRVLDGRVVLEESHGIGGTDGPKRFLGSVPYPSPSNTSFTPDTTPSSRPAKTGGWPVHITNIRRLPDNRIGFEIGYEYL